MHSQRPSAKIKEHIHPINIFNLNFTSLKRIFTINGKGYQISLTGRF